MKLWIKLETLRECITISNDRSLPPRFLLASLQLQHVLRAKGKRNMKAALGTIPSTTDAAFENILERIEQQELGSKITALRTLTWCYYARRPLRVDELCEALVVEDGDISHRDNEINAGSVVDCCLSFTTHDLSTDEFRLIHPSVQRWFDHEPQHQKLLPHSYLAKTCLTYLNFDVFDSFAYQEVARDTIQRHLVTYRFYRYAARFWATHTKDAELELGVQKAAFAFLAAENRRELMLRTRDIDDVLFAMFDSEMYVRRGQTPLHMTADHGLVVLCNLLLSSNSR